MADVLNNEHNKYIKEEQAENLVNKVQDTLKGVTDSIIDKTKDQLQKEANFRQEADNKVIAYINAKSEEHNSKITRIDEELSTLTADLEEEVANRIALGESCVKLNSVEPQNITGGLNITAGVTVDTLKVTDKVNGDLTIDGDTIITKNATITGDVEINGSTTINNNTSIIGQVSIMKSADDNDSSGNLVIDGSLNAKGDITSANITAANQINTSKISADSIEVSKTLNVKDLNVTGTTTTVDQETLAVKDNLIITNSSRVELTTADSGLAINKNATETYGIVYNPFDDSVNLGIGSLDKNNNFVFNENEGLPIVVRDGLVNNNFILYSEDGYKVIDSGISKANYEDKVVRLGQAESKISQLTAELTNETSTRASKDDELQDSIDKEIIVRAEAYKTLQENISAEATARDAADTQLQRTIADEASTREDADTQLQEKIEGEVSTREDADKALQDDIDTEISDRKAADTQLATQIEAETDRAQYQESLLDARLDPLEDVPGDDKFYVMSYDTANKTLKWGILDDGNLDQDD